MGLNAPGGNETQVRHMRVIRIQTDRGWEDSWTDRHFLTKEERIQFIGMYTVCHQLPHSNNHLQLSTGRLKLYLSFVLLLHLSKLDRAAARWAKSRRPLLFHCTPMCLHHVCNPFTRVHFYIGSFRRKQVDFPHVRVNGPWKAGGC